MNYLPFFPLELVVFEGEKVRLHIFEPRYKQLIGEAIRENGSFGMPIVHQGKLEGTGMELKDVKLIQTWPDGEMDIECYAGRRFEVLDFQQTASGKLYSAGFVRFIPFIDNEDKELKLRIADLLKELYSLTNSQGEKTPDPMADVSIWVHKCGLTTGQEIELVALKSASERQLYIINHLKNTLAALAGVQQMKERIRLNGHFKKLTGPL